MFWSITILAAITLTSHVQTEKTVVAPYRAWFHEIAEVHQFSTSLPESESVSHVSPVIKSPIEWDELIVSWNAHLKPAQSITIRAHTVGDSNSKDYIMGIWTPGKLAAVRRSVPNQSDSYAKVDTDTLILRKPAKQFQLLVEYSGPGSRLSNLTDLNVCVFNSKLKPHDPLPPNKAAWGKQLMMAERSQLSYEGGRVWCSPTSVSMVMSYWANQLHRPELDEDVTKVASQVLDPLYPGTGNWPFNTAYAGSFPGMRGYISRFEDISELEDWIEAGIPVVISVSYKLLKGYSTPEVGGHIVVVSGFTPTGDVIVNDPWTKFETGEKVVKTFPRKNLIAAWAKSNNTVYLIHPIEKAVPIRHTSHW